VLKRLYATESMIMHMNASGCTNSGNAVSAKTYCFPNCRHRRTHNRLVMSWRVRRCYLVAHLADFTLSAPRLSCRTAMIAALSRNASSSDRFRIPRCSSRPTPYSYARAVFSSRAIASAIARLSAQVTALPLTCVHRDQMFVLTA
jgi:hypothetical protein